MEAEHFQLPHESHGSPIQGMERVVATVSGYHGSERFNLIKLISHAGANYVGAMSKSVTHVVCWKFEGKKYDIAQKFGIHVVNHRWIEGCIKEGRRVPEDTYTWLSGHEIGSLLLEVPLIVRTSSLTKNKLVSDKSHDSGSERQKTNSSSGASGTYVLEDSCLMKKHEESSSYSSRLSRKGKRDICNGRGVSVVAGPSRKGRRVARNVHEVVLDPSASDLSPNDHLFRMDRLQTDAAATSSLSGGVNNNIILENSEGPDAGVSNRSRAINGGSEDIEQIKDPSHMSTRRHSTLFIDDPLPLSQTIDLCFGDGEKFTDGDQVDNVAALPTSTELSCVICFTDFSSTRGILPCGHRFCFLCIQSWVDHRTSMGKPSTCPLCKESFAMIKKIEHAATADQKIYSQSIPCDNSASDIFVPINEELPDNIFESSLAGACVVCRGREPEDLLESCDVCRARKIHSYCMDPPLRPWTCSYCRELRILYRSNHSY